MAPATPCQCLACFVLASSLLAASGMRRQLGAAVSSEGAQASSGSVGAKLAAEQFALNRSRVEDLCTDEVYRGACEALGARPDDDPDAASATAAELAVILAAGAGEAAALLEAVGLDPGAPFSCRAFCEAAVASIPRILSIAAPSRAGLGCLDAACDEAEVDVSVDALAREGLATAAHSEGADVLELLPGEDTSRKEEPSQEIQTRSLFRMALNVILGIFPAVDEIDGETSEPSLLQRSPEDQRRSDDRPGADVAFGPQVPPTRHLEYRGYVVKASAWIAVALRRLRAGRHVIKTWFILSDESEVDLQMSEAQLLLKRMWQLMSNIVIKKGTPGTACGDGGVVAYVRTIIGCEVRSRRDCGEIDRDGRYVLNVCELFWDPSFSADFRVGTIVHEASHHFGTYDHAYGEEACLALSPRRARNNADTYQEFVERLVRARALQTYDGPGIKHEACNLDCDATEFGRWKFSKLLPVGHCGICREKTRLLGGCGASETTVASGFMTRLCCEPVQCRTTTTTTS